MPPTAKTLQVAQRPMALESPPAPHGVPEPIPGRCNAKLRRRVGLCTQWPMHGQTRCQMHGAKAPAALAAAERRLTLAKVGSMLGVAKDVDPADALLDALRLAAGDTEYLRVQVQQLDEGPTLVTPHGSGAHPVVEMYHASLKRQAEFAALAIKAGIEERRVRLAESASVRLAQIIVTVLDAPELALDARQRSRGRELAHRLMTEPLPVIMGQVIEH